MTTGTSQVVLVVKNLPASVRDIREVGSIPELGWSPGESMAIHSSILAWKISWTEEPGGLQSVGLQRVEHDWSDLACTHIYLIYILYLPSQTLLVGAFNPFTFKVIIYMYDPITIFLTVLGLFSVGLSLLLCFLPREFPLSFVIKLVWWC